MTNPARSRISVNPMSPRVSKATRLRLPPSGKKDFVEWSPQSFNRVIRSQSPDRANSTAPARTAINPGPGCCQLPKPSLQPLRLI